MQPMSFCSIKCRRGRAGREGRAGSGGFTLIEMVITIVIMSIILVGMTPMIKSVVDALIYGRQMRLTDSQAAFSMTRITKELKDADDLATLGATAVSDFQFTTKNLTSTIRYYLSGDQIMRTEGGGAAQPLATGVSSFQVSTANGKLVVVQIGFADANYSLRTTVFARNIP